MSAHHNLRKETSCLNCGTTVQGKYCSECGQLNREPKIEINDLFHDVLHGVLHFDGKFFQTARLLLTKPGFLTTEYISGKRAKYLPPVQMYLFTSAIFFFLLYTFFLKTPTPAENWDSKQNQSINESIKIDLNNYNKNFKSVKDYEIQQSKLPIEKRDGRLKQYFTKQEIEISKKIEENPKKAFTETVNHFIHSFSSLFFVSLPIITLWLGLIFFWKKDINLVGHFIFIIHNYIFDYIVMLLNVVLKLPAKIKGFEFMESLAMLVLIWLLYYGYASMKNFYGLSRRKTLLMFSLTLFGSMVIFIFLFLIYLFLSLSKI
jgi:Protein of unknown function (DUF3667)